MPALFALGQHQALERRRARLVVLGIEVGGRMSAETRSFLSQLAKARARQEISLMRKRASVEDEVGRNHIMYIGDQCAVPGWRRR